MSNPMHDGMMEATRLTREGRLAEATALIQRTLGGAFDPVASPSSPGATDEKVRRLVNGAARPAAPSQPRPARDTLRSAPKPSRGFRSRTRPPGDMPGPTPRTAGGTPGISVGGRFVERSYTNQAGTRGYKLYIPSGYVGQAVPLVVMLHGCTQDPDDFAVGTRMNALAEEHTFLVAYPAQAGGANISRCWNWFQATDQQRGRGEPSLIAGITCEVVGEHHVDAGQVYVAGMSAGGAMAAVMGAAYPDLYAAVGVHSGLAPGAASDLASAFTAMRGGSPGGPVATSRISSDTAATRGSARTVPAILFHGDRDSTVHPRNADRLLAHYWAVNNAGGPDTADKPLPRAVKRQGQVPDGHAYTCAAYHDAGGRVVMEQWTVHGLGHAWSGGSLPGSYTDPNGPDASAEMARFFLQHARREPTER